MFNWTQFSVSFSKEKTIKIATLGDGSCFFHSFLLAVSPEYYLNPMARPILARKLRLHLANLLEAMYKEPYCATYREMAEQGLSEYSLEGLKRTLLFSSEVDDRFNLFLEKLYHVNIYLVNHSNGSLYLTGNENIVNRGYRSIAIIYKPGHYELLGLQRDSGIIPDLSINVISIFREDDPFMDELKHSLLTRLIK